MSDYWTCLWALATGLWWLWSFLLVLAVASAVVFVVLVVFAALDTKPSTSSPARSIR